MSDRHNYYAYHAANLTPAFLDYAERLSSDALIRARIFSCARPNAGLLCQGPDTGFLPGWFPKLAQQFVRNSDDPQLGYGTRAEALDAARRYRASCVEFINNG